LILDYLVVFDTQPGLEVVLVFGQDDDAGAAGEAFFAVGAEAGGPAVTEADSKEGAFVVVDMVVADEGAYDIAGLEHGGEEA
jgi:hypothetical protein